MNCNEKEIELIKAKAIQDYLLTRGHNDEKINTKVRELNLELKTKKNSIYASNKL